MAKNFIVVPTRCFYSEKSFYVLVADTRKQGNDYPYWLNTVLQLAGEDSSVLILLNKKFGHEIKFDRKGYNEFFGSIIKDVFPVDLGADFSAIRDLQDLVKIRLKKLPGIGDKLPPAWVRIREDLAQERKELIEKKEKVYISFDRFCAICARYDVNDASMIETLSVYYNRIGVFSHYIDEPLLRERVYLDSNWLLDTVYKILENEEIKNCGGRLKAKQIKNIWGQNELTFEVDRLAALMHKFGLMYQVDETDNYVVPEHLPADQPYDSWPHKGQALQFIYEFNKYMPHGLMSRLIVQLHNYIENHDYVWNRGVNLFHENTHAEVVESYGAENAFKIRVLGANKEGLLFIIREGFAKVLSPFKNLKYRQLVPCCCSTCEVSDDPNFHEFSELTKLKRKREDTICNTSGENIEINKLLQVTDYYPERDEKKVKPTRPIDPSTLTTLKLFLASSSELEKDRKEVQIWASQKNLDINPRGYNVQPVLSENFLDTIMPEGLQSKYNKALLKCDIALCLFETKIGKFTKEEFKVAYESMKAGNNPKYIFTFFKDTKVDGSDMNALKQLLDLNEFKEELKGLKTLSVFLQHYFRFEGAIEQTIGQDHERVRREHGTRLIPKAYRKDSHIQGSPPG